MTHKLESRVRKLELIKQGPEIMRIVAGYTDEETNRQQAALIASGKAKATDMFIHVRRFGDPNQAA